jgi:hypothetical protein
MADGRIVVVLLIAGALTASGCGAHDATGEGTQATTAANVTSTSSDRELGIVRGRVDAAFWRALTSSVRRAPSRSYKPAKPLGTPRGSGCHCSPIASWAAASKVQGGGAAANR